MDAVEGLGELYANVKPMQIEPHSCGGKASLWPDENGTIVRCEKCMVFGLVMNSPELAIDEWNKYQMETLRIRGELRK